MITEQEDKIKPSPVTVSELRQTAMNIQAICDIISKGITKHSIPLVRRELGKHMQKIDTRYLNIVKELEELESK